MPSNCENNFVWPPIQTKIEVSLRHVACGRVATLVSSKMIKYGEDTWEEREESIPMPMDRRKLVFTTVFFCLWLLHRHDFWYSKRKIEWVGHDWYKHEGWWPPAWWFCYFSKVFERPLAFRVVLMRAFCFVCSTACFDSSTDWMLRFRWRRRFESNARCFKCSFRLPSMRFRRACISDCCWERNFASFRDNSSRLRSSCAARSLSSITSAIRLIFCASA